MRVEFITTFLVRKEWVGEGWEETLGTSDEAAQVLDMTPLDTELALACLASNCAYTGVVATEEHGKAFVARIQQQVFDNFFNEAMSEFYDAHAVAALAVASAEAKKRTGDPEDDQPTAKKARTKAAAAKTPKAKAAAAAAAAAAKKGAKDDVGKQLQAMLKNSVKPEGSDGEPEQEEEEEEEVEVIGASA